MKFSHKEGLIAARLALIVPFIVSAAQAKESRATFAVGATVMAVAHLDVRSIPDSIVVSEGDIARGFVDVAQPAVLVIRSNSVRGYALEVLPVSSLMSSMLVCGFDEDLLLGREGGTIVQRWRSAGTVNVELKFRFSLAPRVTAGRYAWPVQLAVRPLEAI